MVKPNYIVAARGILRWSQEDLARESGVSGRTINLIENEKQNPSQETLTSIQMAFDRAGVVFRADGVIIEDRRITVFQGSNCLMRLFDDIGFALQGGGELLIDGADEKVTPPDLVKKVAKLRSSGMKMRHMIRDGDRYLRGKTNEYRWIPERFFLNQAIFIYGNNVAFLAHDGNSVYVHRDSNLAEFLKNKFNLLWGILKEPDYSEAKDVFDV